MVLPFLVATKGLLQFGFAQRLSLRSSTRISSKASNISISRAVGAIQLCCAFRAPSEALTLLNASEIGLLGGLNFQKSPANS